MQCLQRQLMVMPRSTRHVSSGGLASVIKETLANTLTMKSPLDQVVPRDVEKAKTAEAILLAVHLQIRVLLRKRKR